MNSGFQLYRDKFTVSLKSIYNKINATDPSVCEGLFAHTAERMGQVLEELAHDPQPLVPGYHTRIVDGNQFAATEHRLKELRTEQLRTVVANDSRPYTGMFLHCFGNHHLDVKLFHRVANFPMNNVSTKAIEH